MSSALAGNITLLCSQVTLLHRSPSEHSQVSLPQLSVSKSVHLPPLWLHLPFVSRCRLRLPSHQRPPCCLIPVFTLSPCMFDLLILLVTVGSTLFYKSLLFLDFLDTCFSPNSMVGFFPYMALEYCSRSSSISRPRPSVHILALSS